MRVADPPRALPAFTIHTVVKQSGRGFKHVTSPRIRAWGPTLTGLAVVPILPFLFDKPVEIVTDTVFEWLQEKWYHHLVSSKRAPPIGAAGTPPKDKEL